MAVIGVIHFGYEVVEEEEGGKATAQLGALYPHCNQSDKPNNEHRNY